MSKRTHCDFSCTERMCVTLDKAGVPPDEKWRTLILYMRGLDRYSFLTDVQKAAIQRLILETIKLRDYSDAAFERIVRAKQEILGEPCNRRLQIALAETVSLIEEFGKLVLQRKDDVKGLGHNTVHMLESGVDPLAMVSLIRESFRGVVESMEHDVANLKELSNTDALTQISNRRSFDEHLAQAVAAWEQEPAPLCLMLLDIDNFKQFNDAHGHRIGDQALTTVGRILKDYGLRLQAQVRSPFFTARYGGEEFAVIIQDCIKEEALLHAEAIRQAIRRYNFVIRDAAGAIVQQNVHITVSIGLAEIDPLWQGAMMDNLLEKADKALYMAKRQGRDRVLAFDGDAA